MQTNSTFSSADAAVTTAYPCPPASTNETKDLRSLVTIARPVVIAEQRVAGRRPARADIGRQVLKVDSPIEHGDGVSPQLPPRRRGAELLEEPRLLSRAEHRQRRRIST